MMTPVGFHSRAPNITRGRWPARIRASARSCFFRFHLLSASSKGFAMNRALFAVAALQLAYAALAAPAPEPLMSGWSNPIDPSRDCKISRKGGVLTVEMLGTDHDYDPIRKIFNAPRIVRDIEGDLDLRVRVRIDCQPSGRSTVKGLPSCVSAGFLLVFPDTSQTTCIRFEFGLSQPGIQQNGYANKLLLPPKSQRKDAWGKGIGEDGYAATKDYFCMLQPTTRTWDRGLQTLTHMIGDSGWKDWPFPKKTEYAYLRLEQRGGWFSFFIGPDGEKWTRLSAHSGPPAKFMLGLAAFSTSSEPSKVHFDQLKLTRIKKKK